MENTLIYLLQSALCFAVLFLPFQWLLRKGELIRLNRMLILLTVCLCFVLPLIYHEMPEFIARLIPMGNDSALEYDIEVIGYGNYDDGIIHKIDTETTSLWTVQNILFLIWFIGAVSVLVWHIVSYIHLYNIIGTCKSNSIKLEDGASVYLFKDEIPSMSWMSNIIMSEQDYQSNKAILLHEMAHVKCGHSWDRLLMSLCLVVQWFNPLVWICSDTLNEVHEYEADRNVLRQGVDTAQYQYLLVNKAVGRMMISVVNGFNHSQLKSRIRMMNKSKRSLWSKARYLVLVPMVFLAFLVSAKTSKQESKSPMVSVSIPEVMVVSKTSQPKTDTIQIESKPLEPMRFSALLTSTQPMKGSWSEPITKLPLTLVDDVVVEDINSIDPKTIESIEVIKKGSDFAKPYEERYEAAREMGIILIRTKK